MRQPLPALFFHSAEFGVQVTEIGAIDLCHVHLSQVVCDIHQKTAKGRGHTRVRRNQNDGDVQISGQGHAVQGTCTAESNESEIARIVSLTQRHQTHRVSHVCVGNLENGQRGVLVGQTKRLTDDALNGLLGEIDIELDTAAGKLAPQTSEVDIRVTIRGFRATPVVAHRARLGACGLRPVAKRTSCVTPCQRTSAGTNGKNLDAREANRIAILHVPIVGDVEFAIRTKADVRAGSAHIQADGVLVAGEFRNEAACNGARGNSRCSKTSGKMRRALCGHHAAAGVEQKHLSFVATVLHPAFKFRTVIASDRRQNRIGNSRIEALVLKYFRHNFAGQRNFNIRDLFEKNIPHLFFIL